MTEEHKRKIGKANAILMKIKWQDPEYRQHMSDVHKGQKGWNKGKFTSNKYLAIHMWLNRNFKKEKCESCSKRSVLDWALKKGRKYLHKIDNFMVLCRSCHLKYDYNKARKEKLSKAFMGRAMTWSDKIWFTRRKLAI